MLQNLQKYWHVRIVHWREFGTFWFVYRALFKLLKLSTGLLLQPLALIAHLIGFRKANICERHIGHLAAEPDCLLKLVQAGLLPKRRYFFTVSAKKIANPCLLEYWNNYIPIIKNPFLNYLLSTSSAFGLMKFDVGEFILTESSSARYYEVCSRWGNKQHILALSDAHRKYGREKLAHLKVPPGAWFVCLHTREGGFSQKDEAIHAYRNADIHQCRLAIETISSYGGWVIRMGDSTMTPMSGLPHFVDYAHSKEKSDRMDVFLCAECKLFIGNTSGLFLMSTAFGVPCALVNMIPFSAPAFGSKDIYIPKLYRDRNTGRYLRFPEIFQSPMANYRDVKRFLEAGIEVEENSPEDINALVIEALMRLENQWTPSAGDEERQANFKKLFRKEDYGYHSPSRIGSSFLAKHEHLM